MANPSKRKGDRVEREIVDLLKKIPRTEAWRVPLSGAVGGEYYGDVILQFGKGLQKYRAVGEVKSRKSGSGWKTIAKWMVQSPVHLLFLREDYKSPLVVMDWYLFESLIGGYYAGDKGLEVLGEGTEIPSNPLCEPGHRNGGPLGPI